VRSIEGNKLTINFDKADEKNVIDQFVQRALLQDPWPTSDLTEESEKSRTNLDIEDCWE
jgi:hypothetical protein